MTSHCSRCGAITALCSLVDPPSLYQALAPMKVAKTPASTSSPSDAKNSCPCPAAACRRQYPEKYSLLRSVNPARSRVEAISAYMVSMLSRSSGTGGGGGPLPPACGWEKKRGARAAAPGGRNQKEGGGGFPVR